MITCSKCLASKELHEFRNYPKSKWCTLCRRAYDVAWKDKKRQEPPKYRWTRSLNADGTRTCTKCKTAKALANFPTNNTKLGTKSICRLCSNAASLAWSKANRQHCNEKAKQWRLRNPGKAREYGRAWYWRNPEHARKCGRENRARYLNESPNYRLAIAITKSVWCRLKRRPDGRRAVSAVRDLGCTIAELRQHLESKWLPGMSWENYGKNGWHVDHIRPLAAFDLTVREQAVVAVHYTNLQPLWATDNHKKSSFDYVTGRRAYRKKPRRL